MMFPYPFSRFSYYGYPHNSYFNNSNSHINKNYLDNSNANTSSKNDDNLKYNSVSSTDDRTYGNSSDANDYFEIFGLKLYYDDILLICIIFFLYNEGVKDQGLFIALILLLLS